MLSLLFIQIDEEAITALLSSAPSPERIARKLSKIVLPPAPPGFVLWLEKGRCLREPTRILYIHCIRQFLGAMSITLPDRAPTLKMAYSTSLCGIFYDTISHLVNNSTKVNYHSALMSARTHLRRAELAPKNSGNLLEDFRDGMKQASKQKGIHNSQRKEDNQESWAILWLFYRRIYYGASFLRHFYTIADRFKLAEKEGQVVEPLSSKELNFCNGMVMCMLTATNFQRSGNLSLIEYEDAKCEIRRARKALSKRIKVVPIKFSERGFDRNLCEPAVIKAEGGVKNGGTIKFVVLSPRDQDLLVQYFRIRDHFPREISTTKLFINARGHSVTKNVSAYIRKMGKLARIKKFNCQMLRSLIETENVLDNSNPERDGLSHHLGHSAKIRQRYYVLPDRRHCVQASNRLQVKLEEIGEIENPPVSQCESCEGYSQT